MLILSQSFISAFVLLPKHKPTLVQELKFFRVQLNYIRQQGELWDIEFCVPVILVGGLRSGETMKEILNTTKIELLSLSRPLLCDPDFPKKLKADENAISKCISCNSCYSSQSHRCIFRGKNL